MTTLSQAARKYLDVRFRHRGRNPARGLDCVGLGVVSYADLGAVLPDFVLYGREPYRDGLVQRLILALGEPIKTAPVVESDLQDSQVVVFRFDKEPHHVAIVAAVEYGGTPAFNIIHAHGLAGRVLEQRLTPDMVERITHIFWRPV